MTFLSYFKNLSALRVDYKGYSTLERIDACKEEYKAYKHLYGKSLLYFREEIEYEQKWSSSQNEWYYGYASILSIKYIQVLEVEE